MDASQPDLHDQTESIHLENQSETVENRRPLKHRGSRELHEITIESVDPIQEESGAMAASKTYAARTATKDSLLKQKSVESQKSKESTPEPQIASIKQPTSSGDRPLGSLNQMQFYSGNHFVEVTKGILHLFKENKPTPLGEEAARSELICILSVPTSMTTHDLLQFTAPVAQDIENIRIIRDNKPNQYMVLIKFRNQRSADEFYKNFNGVAFNSIEPEMCHLVYVARIETLKENDSKSGQPIPGHTELPTCPVCLERMDESVEGILTILCNHSFHGNCLDKWGDTSCPVCRYSQTPEPEAQNSCFECAASAPTSESRSEQESLWICLVCGHIGCGRYVEGHAYKHYVDTQHTYAMQLGNNRVWDYAGDNYVHRLLQNKSDGKVVEVECNPNLHANDEKIDAVQLEYTYLLTNQLETQRRYFEETISRIEKDAQDQVKEVLEKAKIMNEERDRIETKLSLITKEKQTHEKKLNQVTAKITKVASELEEERQINKCLRENQTSWQQKLSESESRLKTLIEKKDHEIAELRDQLRDLMFFLDAQQKLQNVPDATREEIESGHIVVAEGASPSASSSKRLSRGKKK